MAKAKSTKTKTEETNKVTNEAPKKTSKKKKTTEKVTELNFDSFTCLKDLVVSKATFKGEALKNIVKGLLDGEEVPQNLIDFNNVITGNVEGTYPISDEIYYVVKYGKNTDSYYVVRDLVLSPKKTPKKVVNK